MLSIEPRRRVGPEDVRESTIAAIGAWFDDIYARKGYAYLRSPHAYSVFLHLLQPQPGHRLLDVGCGPGQLLSQANGYGLEPFGIDLSRVALRMLTQSAPARVQAADAAKLPYADESFSYVTCIGALERMTRPRETLRELWRVSKKGARLCFLVRNSQTLTWRILIEGMGLKNQRGHQGAANLSEWTQRFEQAGFAVRQTLPDQWNLMLRERVLSRLGRHADFTRIRGGLLPLRYANEFIFLLSKEAGR